MLKITVYFKVYSLNIRVVLFPTIIFMYIPNPTYGLNFITQKSWANLNLVIHKHVTNSVPLEYLHITKILWSINHFTIKSKVRMLEWNVLVHHKLPKPLERAHTQVEVSKWMEVGCFDLYKDVTFFGALRPMYDYVFTKKPYVK